MATWARSVQQAKNLIESVEHCLRENGINTFEYVELHPFKSRGGRSEGVSAVFYFTVAGPGGEAQSDHICISVYEHWNTDAIDIRIDNWVPVYAILDIETGHDEPHVEFESDEVNIAVLFIQMMLLDHFKITMSEDFTYGDTWSGNMIARPSQIRKARNKLINYKESQIKKAG